MTHRQDAPDADTAIAQLSELVLGTEPLPAILGQVVQLAVRVMPTLVDASITLVGGEKSAVTAAFTGPTAVALDERQYADGRGPCLHSAASGTVVVIDDMTGESRWPSFTSAAARAGVACSLSVPMPLQGELTGAINFYAATTKVFDDRAVALGEAFAARAAIAVGNAARFESTAAFAEQMRQAMATRAVIEQAKGIVMHDQACTSDEAFDTLVRMSQASHRKLRDVAQRLVDHVSHTTGTSGAEH